MVVGRDATATAFFRKRQPSDVGAVTSHTQQDTESDHRRANKHLITSSPVDYKYIFLLFFNVEMKNADDKMYLTLSGHPVV